MRERLRAALQQSDPEMSAVVADSMTDVEFVATPFLKHTQIVRVEQFMRHGPQLEYFAITDKDAVTLLTRNTAAFQKVMHQDGLQLGTAEEAIAYVQLTVEVLTSRSYLTYTVGAVSEFRFRPSLEPDLQARQQALEAAYSDVVKPMSATAEAAGYLVTYYQICDRNLERVEIQLRKTGEFTKDVTLLEEDMPTVWGL
jgi:hypothetical protein